MSQEKICLWLTEEARKSVTMAFFPTLVFRTLAGRTSSVVWKAALAPQVLSMQHIVYS